MVNGQDFDKGSFVMRARHAFTLIELLVVVSIIALLMVLLLPALGKAREAVQIAVCANNQRQLVVALYTYATDSEEHFPPGSGYDLTTPHRARRGVGDFFDVLVPEYVAPPDLWYCPAGALFADTNLPPLGQPGPDTFWDFVGSGGPAHPGDTGGVMPGHVYITQNVYVNLQEKGGYTDIARKLSDPGDWIVVIDGNYYSLGGSYGSVTNHPGRAANFGLGRTVPGRFGYGGPIGLNTGTVDGSVTWTPLGECVLGYPGSGGTINSTFTRLVEPPREGRPGVVPWP